MRTKIICIDEDVLAELHKRSKAGSYNHRLRQIFGMPPPRPSGRPVGSKDTKKRTRTKCKQK